MHTISPLRRCSDRAIVTLEGNLNEVHSAEIESLVMRAAAAPGTTGVHLDVTRVTSISSTGLDTLLRVRESARRYGLDFTLGVSYDGVVMRFLASTPAWFAGDTATSGPTASECQR
jgi:anti-anti-sigma factor